MSDEKALDESLAEYTDKLLAQASNNPIPPDIAQEAKMVASLQRLIAPKGKPSAQSRQQLALRLGSAFDANEREKLRRKLLPFYKRYPLATAAAAVVVVAMGVVLLNPSIISARSEAGTSVGAIDLVTVVFFLVLGVFGLIAAFFLQRGK